MPALRALDQPGVNQNPVAPALTGGFSEAAPVGGFTFLPASVAPKCLHLYPPFLRHQPVARLPVQGRSN